MGSQPATFISLKKGIHHNPSETCGVKLILLHMCSTSPLEILGTWVFSCKTAQLSALCMHFPSSSRILTVIFISNSKRQNDIAADR